MEGVGDMALNHLKAVQARPAKGSLFLSKRYSMGIQDRETDASPCGFKNAALYQFDWLIKFKNKIHAEFSTMFLTW